MFTAPRRLRQNINFGGGPSTGGGGIGYRLGTGGYLQGNPDTYGATLDQSLNKIASLPGGVANFQIIYYRIFRHSASSAGAARSAVGSYMDRAHAANLSLSDYVAQYGGGGGTSSSKGSSSKGSSSKGPGAGTSQADPSAFLGSGTYNNISYGPTTVDTNAANEISAFTTLRDTYLEPWGLGGLANQAWTMISDPGNHAGIGDLLAWVRGTDEYKARFPGLAERTALGYPPISESQYLNEQNVISGALRYYGIPTSFATTQEIGNLIAHNVSSSEVTDRLKNGYELAMKAPPEVRQLLHDYYGVNTGQLAAYYLNPAHTVEQLSRQTQGALIGNESMASGFGRIDKGTATQLAEQEMTSPTSMDLNYFRQGFAKLAPLKPLETAMVGQRGQATASQKAILGEQFAGLNQSQGTTAAGNKAAVQLAEQARVAGLAGGGGFVQGAKGAIGVGAATTEGQGGRSA